MNPLYDRPLSTLGCTVLRQIAARDDWTPSADYPVGALWGLRNRKYVEVDSYLKQVRATDEGRAMASRLGGDR